MYGSGRTEFPRGDTIVPRLFANGCQIQVIATKSAAWAALRRDSKAPRNHKQLDNEMENCGDMGKHSMTAIQVIAHENAYQ